MRLPGYAVGDVGKGGAVVLGHPIALDRSVWASVADELAATHRVVTWDAPGHGKRPPPHLWTYADAADEVAAMLQGRGITRAVVGGVEQGAHIALHVAARHPRLVAGLILVSCGNGVESLRSVPAEMAWLGRWGASGPDPDDAGAVAEHHFGRGWPGSQAWLGRWAGRAVTGYVPAFRAFLGRVDPASFARGITAPALVVRGGEDPTVSAAAADGLAASLPRSKGVVTIDGAPHVPPATDPIAVTDTISAFLDEIGWRPRRGTVRRSRQVMEEAAASTRRAATAATLTVAVIGPTNVERVGAAGGIAPQSILARAASVGTLLAAAGHRMIVVPDRGVAVAALRAYRGAGGPEVIGIAPTAGPSEQQGGESIADGNIATNLEECDIVVRECTWFEQHHTIGRLSDAMICVGLSPGTLAELAWTKWTPGPPTAIVAGTSSPPPPELLAETPTTVVTIEGLGRWLRAIVPRPAEKAL